MIDISAEGVEELNFKRVAELWNHSVFKIIFFEPHKSREQFGDLFFGGIRDHIFIARVTCFYDIDEMAAEVADIDQLNRAIFDNLRSFPVG